jgi:hypothetical protein
MLVFLPNLNMGASPALIITLAFHSALISPSGSPTPWTIDPERTQELVDATTPNETAWSTSYGSVMISTDSPAPTPWSIDPERTQDMNA